MGPALNTQEKRKSNKRQAKKAQGVVAAQEKTSPWGTCSNQQIPRFLTVRCRFCANTVDIEIHSGCYECLMPMAAYANIAFVVDLFSQSGKTYRISAVILSKAV